MTQVRSPFVQTRRDAWVEVDLGNIEYNVKALKALIPSNTKFLAVVKADAYGHGATMTAPTLIASGVDVLGVASIDEGMQLREAGIDAPILVLGSAPSWSFIAAVENDIQLSIFTEEHINACISAYNKLGIKPKVHIKVDTGMHRIGISADEANEFISKVNQIKEINLQGVFTHLACAENTRITDKQRIKWEGVINQINDMDILIHAVNTAGLISYPDMKYNMIRSGIGIYGLMPDLSPDIKQVPELKQVMNLKGRVVHIQNLEQNSGISYGYSFVTSDSATKVATIPIGYADGVDRRLSNRIWGLINGKIIRQIGNITMDQMMFDVSNIDTVETGDIITLLGQDGDETIPIDVWAKKLQTINYEITCKLRVRLPRVYTRS
jgi:alanine racemase